MTITGKIGIVGDGAQNGENGFLRILIAEEDDIGAFVAHCEINKLPYAYSIQRITRIDEARDKVVQFNPRLILVGESYANASFVAALRKLGISLPIICVVKDHDIKRAEEVLKAGATDSLFVSQRADLARCLDGHLSGKVARPFYSQTEAPPPKRLFSVNTERFHASVQNAWIQTKSSLARTPANARKLAKKMHDGFVRLRILSSTLWKKIKIRSLVKTADLIATTKAGNGSGAEPSASWKSQADGRKKITDLWDRWAANFHRQSQSAPAWHNQSKSDCAQDSNGAFRTLELAFKTLFHTSLDGVLLVDNAGAVLHANSAACVLLGFPPAELLGKKLLEFVQSQRRPDAEAAWEMLLTLASHEGDLEIVNGRGERKEVHFRGRTNLWFGVHLLILKEKAIRPLPMRDSLAENLITNPA